MGLIKLAALGAVGYGAYRYYQSRTTDTSPAFAGGKPVDHDSSDEVTPIRDAGPAAMRDEPRRKWTEVDQAADESFPASDAPATY